MYGHRMMFDAFRQPLTRQVILVIFISVATIPGCRFIGDEIRRERSPDGAIDAVISYSPGGAIGAAVHSVILVDAGGRLTSGVVVFQGKRLFGLDVQWESANRLVVRYAGGEPRHHLAHLRGKVAVETVNANSANHHWRKPGKLPSVERILLNSSPDGVKVEKDPPYADRIEAALRPGVHLSLTISQNNSFENLLCRMRDSNKFESAIWVDGIDVRSSRPGRLNFIAANGVGKTSWSANPFPVRLVKADPVLPTTLFYISYKLDEASVDGVVYEIRIRLRLDNESHLLEIYCRL